MQRVPPELTRTARSLRTDATPEERQLWSILRQHRPRFTRQLVIDRFVVDFACRSVRLAVELDGGHHALQIGEDEARTRYLEVRGWRVLRFWNNEVRHNLEGVMAVISTAARGEATHPRPLPFREGG